MPKDTNKRTLFFRINIISFGWNFTNFRLALVSSGVFMRPFCAFFVRFWRIDRAKKWTSGQIRKKDILILCTEFEIFSIFLNLKWLDFKVTLLIEMLAEVCESLWCSVTLENVFKFCLKVTIWNDRLACYHHVGCIGNINCVHCCACLFRCLNSKVDFCIFCFDNFVFEEILWHCILCL